MHIAKSMLLCAFVSVSIHSMENVDSHESLIQRVQEQDGLIKQQKEEIERLNKQLVEATVFTAELVTKLYDMQHPSNQMARGVGKH